MATISDEQGRRGRQGGRARSRGGRSARGEGRGGDASRTSSSAGDVPASAWEHGAPPGREPGAPPERVGAFVVESELARGGMGVVYVARDERLGRRVALKALPEGLAQDAVRRARLEREARLLALVNHPGVATIHGVEDEGGRAFLVLEHVEGETLREVLDRGRMELPAALRLLAQAAEAVDAAHERGVVHRDLKPENVKVTPQGRVKVLDFGLARVQAEPDEGTSELAVLEDEDERELTRSGARMGTPGYMSPEQARGEAADRRSDAWALGCIAYECLTGERAWGRGSARERLKATRWRGVDWALVPAEVPTGVRQALAACLEKDLARRLARVGEFKEALEAGLAELEGRAGAPEAPARRGNLPRQLTSFLGREEDLRGLATSLSVPGLVTLVGPGGTGKTRLAIEAARRAAGAFEGGAWFVDLAPVRAGVVPAVVAALGLVESAGTDLQAQVEAHVGKLRVLLILDNCEHLVEEAAATAGALVSACGGLTVVATSREPLAIPGEEVVEVRPLGVPAGGAPVNVEEAGRHDAVRLWTARARSADARFALSDSNVDAVVAACRLLDGLPLAIELAAARARTVPAEQVVAVLGSGGDLRGTGRGRPERHRTLRGLIEWSHGLLTPEEAAAYRRMGAFAGGVPLDAVEAVVAGGPVRAGEVIDLVARLAEKSLVAVEARGGEALYRLLETVKAHAREKLAQSSETEETRRRHLAWVRREAAKTLKHLGGADALRVAERAGELVEEATAVVAWAPGAGEGEAALEVACAWARALRWRCKLAAGLELLRAALDATVASAPSLARVLAHFQVATFHEEAWRLHDALGASEEAHSEASSLGDPEAMWAARACRASALVNLGRSSLARTDCEALSGAAPTTNRMLVAAGHRARTLFLVATGDRASAVELARAWLATLSRHERPGDFANARDLLAHALGAEPSETRECLEEARAILGRLGRTLGHAALTMRLGVWSMDRGDLRAARSSLEDALDEATRIGAIRVVTKALQSLGNLALIEGRAADARQLLRQSVPLAAQLGSEQEVLNGLIGLGEAELALGNPELAVTILMTARSVNGRHGLLESSLRAVQDCERAIAACIDRLGTEQVAAIAVATARADLASAVRLAQDAPLPSPPRELPG